MPLPEQFRYEPDDSTFDDAATEGVAIDPETTEAILPTEPVGDGEGPAEEPAAEEEAASPKLSVDEWADILLAPNSNKRIAEAPASMRGAILDAKDAKFVSRAEQIAQLAEQSGRARGIEEGRQALAREMLVQQVDQMDAYQREEFFKDEPAARQKWHAAKAGVQVQSPPQPVDPRVAQIQVQGSALLRLLDGHPQRDAILAESRDASKYPATESGLSALSERVRNALAGTATASDARDEADAKQTQNAAQILKSGPRTTRLGSGGAAAVAPLTPARLASMSEAEITDFMNRYPDGEKQVARAQAEHARTFV